VDQPAKSRRSDVALDSFKLDYEQAVSSEVTQARPGDALVAVRNLHALWTLERVLERTDTEEQDGVVMTVWSLTGPHSGERDFFYLIGGKARGQ